MNPLPLGRTLSQSTFYPWASILASPREDSAPTVGFLSSPDIRRSPYFSRPAAGTPAWSPMAGTPRWDTMATFGERSDTENARSFLNVHRSMDDDVPKAPAAEEPMELKEVKDVKDVQPPTLPSLPPLEPPSRQEVAASSPPGGQPVRREPARREPGEPAASSSKRHKRALKEELEEKVLDDSGDPVRGYQPPVAKRPVPGTKIVRHLRLPMLSDGQPLPASIDARVSTLEGSATGEQPLVAKTYFVFKRDQFILQTERKGGSVTVRLSEGTRLFSSVTRSKLLYVIVTFETAKGELMARATFLQSARDENYYAFTQAYSSRSSEVILLAKFASLRSNEERRRKARPGAYQRTLRVVHEEAPGVRIDVTCGGKPVQLFEDATSTD